MALRVLMQVLGGETGKASVQGPRPANRANYRSALRQPALTPFVAFNVGESASFRTANP